MTRRGTVNQRPRDLLAAAATRLATGLRPMSDRSPADDEAAVEQMVSQVDPAWRVRSQDAIDAGRHRSYRVRIETDAGERDSVLKVPGEEGFATEPRLLSVLGAETSLPVPAVLGVVDDHGDLPPPFFMMTALPGRSVHKRDTDTFSRNVLEGIAVSSGRQLAELHSLDAVDAFGPIEVDAGDPLRGGTPSGDPGLLSVPGGDRSWPAHLDGELADLCEELRGTRFKTVGPEIRSRIDPLVDNLRSAGQFEPVVGRVEQSLDNLLFDPEDGTVTGLLDWEFVAGTTAAMDLTLATFWLSGGPWSLLPATPDYRDPVREGLLRGYRAESDGSAIDEFHDHGDLYRLVNLLRVMALFDGMFDALGTSEERRGRAAEVLESRVGALAKEL